MKPIRRLIQSSMVLVAFLFLVSCQNSIMDPTSPSNEASENSVSLTGVNPEIQAFAKTQVLSHNSTITDDAGGKLGGPQTGDNYIEIPAGAVPQNTYFTFSVLLIDGYLVFEIQARDYEGENFPLDRPATLAVNKEWLSGQPEVLVNFEDLEDVATVEDGGTHWIAQVSHFSKWSWGILE